MNSTVNSSSPMVGLAYSIGLFVGVLTLILLLTFASYFCTRTHRQSTTNTNPINRTVSFTNQDSVILELGLDEETLRSYPKLLYSQAKHIQGDSVASSCSICLGEYKDNDMLRLLPDCGHLFHLKCVDSWLRMNPSCPICRHSPMPTPLTTPLAEVIPLAMQRPR